MKRKLFTLLLAAIMAGSALTGCGGDGNSETESSAPEAQSSAAENSEASESGSAAPGELELPIVSDGSVTLTLYEHTRLGVDDFENNEFTTWLQDQTGIQLDFIVSPEQSALEKLNVLLVSGDYPDVITGNIGMPSAQINLYGQQGIFLALNDYIDQYGVNTQKAFEAYPAALDIITMPDGNIYALPDINDCYHIQMDYKMWVYQPWLDTLGLEVPQTTEEFRDMLVAFKEQDPNGNGQADEIPMMGSYSGGASSLPELFLMNSFVYYDATYCGGLYVDNGQITASYTSDAWKEGLKYLNGLIRDGLLAPETYTQDNSVLIQNAENPTPILGAVPSMYMGMFCQIDASDRWKDFVAISPVEGPEGVRYCKWSAYAGASMKYIITSACEHPVEAFKLADFLYTEEATLRSCNGPEGVGWQYLDEDSGKLGIDGEPADYEILIGVDDQPANSSWNQGTIGLRTSDFRNSAALAEASAFEAPLHYMTEDNYAPYQPPIEMVIPPLFFTEEQSNELLNVETSVTNYLKEKTAGFITGALDIDAEWDTYLAELEAMGLPTVLEIYQAAYEEATAN